MEWDGGYLDGDHLCETSSSTAAERRVSCRTGILYQAFSKFPRNWQLSVAATIGGIELIKLDNKGIAGPAPVGSASTADYIVRIGVRLSPGPAIRHRERLRVAGVGIWSRRHQQSPGGMACPPIERWQKGSRDHGNGFLPSDWVWR